MGLTEDQEQQLMRLYATKFISRPNPVAVQTASGIYVPNKQLKFNKQLLTDHLRGRETYGHYILGEDSTCKFICFDLDLVDGDDKSNTICRLPTKSATHEGWENLEFSDWQPGNAREIWRSRKQGPAREFLKFKMRVITNQLAQSAHELLGMPVAVSYTGNKGMHVYVMIGKTSGAEAREAAKLILDHRGEWFPHRAFYKFVPRDANLLDDPEENNEQFSLEVFPKQEALEPDKPLGNLLRLPLGVNKKSPKDPTFFVDLRSALGEIKPMDPIEALTTNNPWR